MIDIEMLDDLARPSGRVYSGKELPPRLDEYFARIVRDGWRPRHPCTDERELATLETSIIRGDCIAPLLVEGDVVYIDCAAQALPGDVASFKMSQRLVDLQNANPPPGQSPTWRKGDAWCKLLGTFHGFEMLFDRHGNSMTATLAACESPDDTPILHPVRNVLRAGRLLFGPDRNVSQIGHASQVGFNAATDTYLTTYSPAQTLSCPASSSASMLLTGYALFPFDTSYDYEIRGSAQCEYSAGASGSYTIYLSATVATPPSYVAGGVDVGVAPFGGNNPNTLVAAGTVVGLAHGNAYTQGEVIRCGVAVTVSQNSASAQTFTFRDVLVQVTRVKR